MFEKWLIMFMSWRVVCSRLCLVMIGSVHSDNVAGRLIMLRQARNPASDMPGRLEGSDKWFVPAGRFGSGCVAIWCWVAF